MDQRRSEGSKCTCEGGIEGKEHAKFLSRVDESFKQDYDRFSERRLSSPTTETIQAKVLATKNGHSTKSKV